MATIIKCDNCDRSITGKRWQLVAYCSEYQASGGIAALNQIVEARHFDLCESCAGTHYGGSSPVTLRLQHNGPVTIDQPPRAVPNRNAA